MFWKLKDGSLNVFSTEKWLMFKEMYVFNLLKQALSNITYIIVLHILW